MVTVQAEVPSESTVPSEAARVTALPSASTILPSQESVVSTLSPVTIHLEVASMVSAQAPSPPSPAQDSSSRIAPVSTLPSVGSG